MSVTKVNINHNNISQYRSQSWPSVTEITWRAGELDESVLENFSNAVKLDCNGNRLKSLRGIQYLTRLKELYCSRNELFTLDGIQACTSLEILNCGWNHLVSLSEASNCRNLLKLTCDNNKLESIKVIECFPTLTSLNCWRNPLRSIIVDGAGSNLTHIDCQSCELESIEGISAYSNLEIIWCHNNRIGSLKGIEGCSRLRKFYGCGNRLSTLEGLSACPLLKTLTCSKNRLKSLAEISTLSNLQYISCDSNKIASLDPVVYLKRLTFFSYDGNPLDIQSERFRRYIEQYRPHRSWFTYQGRASSRKTTVYDNGQNVHDIHIQQSVCKSLVSLLADPKPKFSTMDLLAMIMHADMDDHAKQLLTEYCSNSYVHSDHMISYSELLSYVWNRITSSKHSTELFKILSQLILDSDGKCFTGRFNRTLSVLVGFFPDIVIEISDTSRISAIIITIQKRINPYDPATHAKTATVELQQAGYTLDEIKPWIDAISDV